MAKITGTADPVTAPHTLLTALIAETFGTFILVIGVIGTALFSSPNTGYLGVALAVGLSVIAAIYAVGHLSGGHFNPAVSLGLALAGRFSWRRVLPYSGAQVLGGVIATSALFVIATGKPGFARQASDAGFASNGFNGLSPENFGLVSVILVEVVLTALFVLVILGVTDARNTTALSPLVIGFTLMAIHLIAIPVSNASFNPARSIATALFGGGEALSQLIVFILAPLIGAAIAGLSYKVLFSRSAD